MKFGPAKKTHTTPLNYYYYCYYCIPPYQLVNFFLLVTFCFKKKSTMRYTKKKKNIFVIASQIGKDSTIRTKQDTLFFIICYYLFLYICICFHCLYFTLLCCETHSSFLSVTINVMYRISGTPYQKFWGQTIVAARN